MNDLETNKHTIQTFIQRVWIDRDLAALPDFWTADCINHAMPGTDNRGLAGLRAYHEHFFGDFAAFSHMQIVIVQQVAEGDRVVTHLTTQADHSGTFFGLPPTGKRVALVTMRIDRLHQGKIAEHWSVADIAGLMQQLQA